MKNFPHRWMTMKKKKSSTLQRCNEFTKRPTVERCHHAGPSSANSVPVMITTASADIVRAPKM